MRAANETLQRVSSPSELPSALAENAQKLAVATGSAVLDI